MAKLVETLHPDLCFISEYGEELKEYREEISEIFQEAFENSIVFLPADIGLKFNIDTKKINAITVCNPTDHKLGYDYVEPDKVKTCLLRKDYSLHYFSSIHKIDEAEIVQILIDGFNTSNR